MTGTLFLAQQSLGITGKKSSYGASFLALLHPEFPCRTALQTFRGVPERNLEILWGTFGNSLKCLERWANNEIPKTLIVHFSNESCRRLNRCREGEFLPHLTPIQYDRVLRNPSFSIKRLIARRGKRITEALNSLPGTNLRVLLSLGLESDFSLPAAQSLATILQGVTGYEIVHNPLDSNRVLFDSVHELHDPRKSCSTGSIFVNDGTDLSFPHRRSIDRNALSISGLRAIWDRNERTGCAFQFAWWARSQGRGTTEFLDPRSRDFRFSREDALVINKLIRRQYVAR